MDKNLKQKIAELKEYGDKPVGVFGARASGKTMFFTILYGLSGFKSKNDRFSIMCDDDDTRKYLSKNYAYLQEGELLPRTEINDVKKVVMNYVYNENNYVLRSFDFAGELLKENTIEEKEIASVFLKKQEKIYTFFANCSSILIFLEPTDDTKETLKRQTEIDKLLGILREAKGREGQKVPLGLVVTKWDKINPEVMQSTEKEEEKRVLDYITKHRVYKNIYHLLSGVSEDVKVFPVSAFGKAKEGDYPPDDLSEPFNVFGPLIWASKSRDVVWTNKIKSILKMDIPLKDAKEIVDSYYKNVENKDMIGEIEQAFNTYKTRIRTKKIIKVAAMVVIVSSLATTGLYFAHQKTGMYQSAHLEQDVKKKLEKIDKFVIKYGVSDEKSKKLLEEKKGVLVAAIDAEVDTEKKLQRIDEFLREYSGKDAVKEQEVAAKKAEIERMLATDIEKNKIKKEVTQAYGDLQNQIASEKDSLRKYRAIKLFLESYPNSQYDDVLKEDMNKYLKLADREKYQEIDNIMKSSDRDDSAVFDKLEEYLAVADFTEYRKEVSAIKESLREEDLYRGMKNSVDNYNKNPGRAALKEVIVKTANYRANNKTGKYLDKANSYVNQIKNIEKGMSSEIEIYVNAKSVDIKGKKVEAKLAIGKQIYYVTKSSVSEGTNREVYIGSKNDKIGVDSTVDVMLYITDASGKESIFGPETFKLEDFNSYKSLRGIDVLLRTDTDKFKIK